MPGRFILDIFEKLGDTTKAQVVSEVLGGHLDSHCHFTLLYSYGRDISAKTRKKTILYIERIILFNALSPMLEQCLAYSIYSINIKCMIKVNA